MDHPPSNSLINHPLTKSVLDELQTKFSITNYDMSLNEEERIIHLLWKRDAVLAIDIELKELLLSCNGDQITYHIFSEDQVHKACQTLHSHLMTH